MFEMCDGRASVVYFAVAEKIKHVKIGVTSNVQSRLASIQNGCPVDVDIRGTVFGTVADEATLHATFAAYRVRGEWFKLDGKLAKLMSDLRYRNFERCVVDGEVAVIRDLTDVDRKRLIDQHVAAFNAEATLDRPKLPSLNCHMTVALLAAKCMSESTGVASEVRFEAVMSHRFQPAIEFQIADPRTFDVPAIVQGLAVIRHANRSRNAIRMTPLDKPNHDSPDVQFSIVQQPFQEAS